MKASAERGIDVAINEKSVGDDERSVNDEAFYLGDDPTSVGYDAFLIARQPEKRRA
jgi:hypothetical protein